MYRKRQRGGNFKGKKYQRSKPKKQEGGNVVRRARRTGRKLVGKVKNSEPQIVALGRSRAGTQSRWDAVALGRSLGLIPQPMNDPPPPKRTVQKGGSIRRNGRNGGPPKRQRNTIPGARYVMYHP